MEPGPPPNWYVRGRDAIMTAYDRFLAQGELIIEGTDTKKQRRKKFDKRKSILATFILFPSAVVLIACLVILVFKLLEDVEMICLSKIPYHLKKFETKLTESRPQIHVVCNGTGSTPVKHIWECNFDFNWVVIGEFPCRCFEDPPAPDLPSTFDWEGKRDLGLKVNYFCRDDQQKFFTYKIIRCTNEKLWKEELNLENLCTNTSHLCIEEPPKAEPGTVRAWNGTWYRIGTVIPYLCDNLHSNEISKTIMCDLSQQWVTIYTGHCGCRSHPPQPSKKIEYLWHGGFNYGAFAIYFCSPDRNGLILLSYICLDGVWQKVFRGSCALYEVPRCTIPPPAVENLEMVFPSERYQVGSVVGYMSSEVSTDIKQVVLCNKMKQWEVKAYSIGEKLCSKNYSDIQTNLTSINLGGVENSSVVGSNRIHLCATNWGQAAFSPIYRTYICSPSGYWKLYYQGSCSIYLPFTLCEGVLPVRVEGTFLHWPRRDQSLGAQMFHTCVQEDVDAIVRVYFCSDWAKWVLTSSSSCYCHYPKAELQTEHPNFFIIEPDDYHIGNKITVLCLNSLESPIHRIYTCTSNLTWSIDTFVTCMCQRPDDGDFPVTLQLPRENKTVFYAATVRYTCSEDPYSFVTSEKKCIYETSTNHEVMKLITLYSRPCPALPTDCQHRPPHRPIFADWDWNEVSQDVGTLIRYFCHQDETRLLMVAICNRDGKWNSFYTMASCGCIHSPPNPPRNVRRIWNGDYHFGTVVYYTCHTKKHSRVLRTLACNKYGRWQQIFRGSCRSPDYAACKYNYPKTYENVKSLKHPGLGDLSGATITIYCLDYNKDNNPDVNVIYVCEAYSEKWKVALNESCGCEHVPELPDDDIYKYYLHWNGRHNRGTIAQSFCFGLHQSTRREISMCNKNRWNTIYKGACACYGEPPQPRPVSLRIWDLSNKIGANITYMCSADITSPIEQTFICRSNGQWVPQYEYVEKRCICSEFPEPPSPLITSWEMNKVPNVGSFLDIKCNSNTNAPLVASLRCFPNTKWMIISNYNWTFEIVKQYGLLNRSYEHFIKGVQWPSIEKKFTGVEFGTITNICEHLLQAGLEFRKEWERLRQCRCECWANPPTFSKHITSDWSEKNTKFFDDRILYWCSGTKDVAFTAVCGPHLLWLQDGPETVCECTDDLILKEEYIKYKKYPSYIDNKNFNRFIGAVISYHCSDHPNSPILLAYKCLHLKAENKNSWVLINTPDEKNCQCNDRMLILPDGSLPPVSMRVPSGEIDYEYGNEWPPFGLQNWIGTKYLHLCGKDIFSGIGMMSECGTDLEWKITKFSGTCIECDGDPPTGPGIRNWDGSRLIGSVVPYLCTLDEFSMHIMDWKCDRKSRTWVQIYNGSCECGDVTQRFPLPLTIQGTEGVLNRSVGVNHPVTCNEDRESPIVGYYYCLGDGTWNDYEQDWQQLKDEKCFCSPPPELEPYIRSFNVAILGKGKTEYVGTIVEYRCTGDHHSPNRFVFKCSNQLHWEEIENNEHACYCLDEPPETVDNEFRDWSGNRLMGTIINYKCEIHSPITKFAVECSIKNKWTKKAGRPSDCTCYKGNLPLVPQNLLDQGVDVETDTNSYQIGNETSYFCNNFSSSPKMASFRCNIDIEWELVYPFSLDVADIKDEVMLDIYNFSCSCSRNLEPAPAGSHIYINDSLGYSVDSVVTYQCTENMTNIFYKKLKCGMQHEWFEIESANSSDCKCPGPPPTIVTASSSQSSRRSITTDWIDDIYVGAVVHYFCDDSKDAYFQILHCSESKSWDILLHPNKDGSCDCPLPPPAPPEKRLKMAHDDEKVAEYYCSDDPNQGTLYNLYYKIVKCNKKRIWEELQSRECLCPENYPEIEDTATLVFMEPKDRSPGTGHVTAACSNHTLSPKLEIFKCSDKLVWELLVADVKGAIDDICKCKGKPPPPQHPQILVWNGDSTMFNEAKYKCHIKSNAPVYLNMVCEATARWTPKEQDPVPTLIHRSCYCPLPPTPHSRTELYRSTNESVYVFSSFSYHCGRSVATAQFAHYICNYDLQWNVEQISTCECSESPVQGIPADNLNIFPSLPVVVGTEVSIYCSADKSRHFTNYTCTEQLLWETNDIEITMEINAAYIKECTCGTSPPVPETPDNVTPYVLNDNPYFTKHWSIDMVVEIYCNNKSRAVAGIYMCMPSRMWELIEIPSKDKCVCEDSPPKPPQPYYSKWEEDDNEVGTIVYYNCSHHISSPLKMTVLCADNRTWVILTEQTCECDISTLPEVPKPLILKKENIIYRIHDSIPITCSDYAYAPVVQYVYCDHLAHWKFFYDMSPAELITTKCRCESPEKKPPYVLEVPSLIVGSVAKYYCIDDKDSGVFESYTCDYSRSDGFHWRFNMSESCECSSDPPEVVDEEHRIWFHLNRFIGAEVMYRCNKSPTSPVKYSVKCLRTKNDKVPEWKKLKTVNTCVCPKPPPQIPGLILTFYPTNKNTFGTYAKYTCTNASDAHVVSLKTCDETNKWQVVEGPATPSSKSCSCESLPEFDSPMTIIYTSKLMGSTATVWCTKNTAAGFFRKYICDYSLQWVLHENGSCECGPLPKFDPPHQLKPTKKWTFPTAIGATYNILCNISEKIYFLADITCTEAREWKKDKQLTCLCSEPPPQPDIENIYITWNHLRRVTDIAYYSCLPDQIDKALQTATCSITDNKWHFSVKKSLQQLRDENCTCDGEPPEAPLNYTRVWHGKRFVGSEAIYECLSGIIEYTYKCNLTLKWQKFEHEKCECPSIYPPSGKGFIISTSHIIGSFLHYTCTSDFADGLSKVYRCTNNLKWVLQDEYLCTCRFIIPQPPVPNLYIEWYKITIDELGDALVGSEVHYKCSRFNSSRVVQKAACTSHLSRNMTQWNLLFDLDMNWEPHVSQFCYCSTDPPPPMNFTYSDWDNETYYEGAEIRYYCSDHRHPGELPIATAICMPTKTWDFDVTESWEKLLAHKCYCDSVPEVDFPHVATSWDGATNRVGSIIIYWCNKAMTRYHEKWQCMQNKQWVQIANGSCIEEYCAMKTDYGYDCLYYSYKKNTYTSAQMLCGNDNMKLTTVMDVASNDAFVNCAYPGPKLCEGFFMNIQFNSQKEYWSIGEYIFTESYEKWIRMRNSNENCAVITKTGGWLPVRCDSLHCTMCSKPSKPSGSYYSCNLAIDKTPTVSES